MKHFPTLSSRRALLPPLAALSFLAAGPAHAVLLIADFNDISAGTPVNKAGGTGFSGNWSGSASSNIIAGDLTSTLYNVPQTGTAQALRNGNNGGVRQNFRTVANSPTGEIWFSFLTRTMTSADETDTESAGISLNPANTGTPFNDRGDYYIQMTGGTLVYSFGAGTAGSQVISSTPGVASDKISLIVGRLTINAGGAADAVSLWVDPDLIANSDISAYTPAYSSTTINMADTITRLGAISYQNADPGLTGGTLDNIRFSDGAGDAAQAFYDVTGVPEPSGLALALLGAGGFLARRRR
ncbi:PEP-CTERM sorting domain-containing protein [Luteolibacter sp. SL250]|uniref:PEP-CTERM sorting domain-containing protein n=1 Tax=Luteolibacter sp. SL250 TaxID=2995170 RepID=UPI00226DF1AB|nr:PEP-CTERM sorting domain-containing protein [Luteolibacter sp. SL250]WAC21540.1 PEP-CTERM sorting domain-containing protein [Luteolibacter sp. SL250]